MFLKKLFSNTLIYAIGPQIPKIAGIFVLPIVTRFLTSEDYGTYGIITSYVGLLGALSDLGFSVILVNSFYRFPKKWKIIWKQLHFYLILWSIVYGILIAILLFFVMPVSSREKLFEIIALISFPAILFNSTIIIGSRYYQFSQKPLYMGITSGLVGVIAIILNLYTIAYLKLGYMGWFYSTAISTFIQFLFFIRPVYFQYDLRPLLVFRKIFIRNTLKISLPVIPHNYSSFLLNSSDRIIMDKMNVKVSSIGEYNMAYIFGNYFEIFGGAIGMAVGPMYTSLISKKSESSEKDLYFLTHWLQASFLLVGFIISLWSKELFALLISNEDLKKVYPLAIIIIMGYVYRPYYWNAITKLEYFNKTSELWKISFVAGLVNILLNIIFIPMYGIMAAAVSTFVSMLYIGFSGYFLKTYKNLETVKYHPVFIIFIILAFTICVYCLKDSTFVVKAFTSISLFSVYLIYFISKKNRFLHIKI